MGNRIETRLEDVELRLTEAESGIEEANALGEKAVMAASAVSASTSTPAGSVAPRKYTRWPANRPWVFPPM